MSRTSILLICLGIVLLGAGYYFFMVNRDTDPTLTTDGTSASNAELEFMALVGQLDPITFDTALLNDPRFTSRRDIRTTIIPEQAGRVDPFAPLGR